LTEAFIGNDDDGLVVKGAMGEAGENPLVALMPDQWKGISFQFPAVGRAKARAGQPKHRLAARILFQYECVGQKRLDFRRLDFRSSRRRPPVPEPVPILE